MKKTFMNIDNNNIGNLKYDKILFESYYPILFTCLNKDNDLFLCVCCQNNKDIKKWLITKTSPEIIIKLLSDQITIRESFLKFTDIQLSITIDLGGKKSVVINDDNDWNPENSIYLPDKDEYMDVEKDEFIDEIKHYERMISNICYNSSYIYDIFTAANMFKQAIEADGFTSIIRKNDKNNDVCFNCYNYNKKAYELEYDKNFSVDSSLEPLKNSLNLAA